MKKHIYPLIAGIILLTSACKKDWLDAKSDISTIVPQTLEDMKLLLNNSVLNTNYTAIGEASSDDIFVSNSVFSSLPLLDRNIYSWQSTIFIGTTQVLQWNNCYNQIFISNVVLEGLNKLEGNSSRQTEWNNIRGQALFHRAKALYDLHIVFSKPYNLQTAEADPGISIRLNSDINIKTVRSSVQEGYNQIRNDLKEAVNLLYPLPKVGTDPSKVAALALLARISLSMGEFEDALTYSSQSLSMFNTLIDYNSLNSAATSPFTAFNQETSYYAIQALITVLVNANINPDLINIYSNNDMRKSVFFKLNSNGTYSFKGSYTGSILPFGGFSTNELYLIQAECFARKGNTFDAMKSLNTLLVKRFKTGTFIPLIATNAEAALDIILKERRKELVYRGMRWQDLRRLNLEPKFAKNLSRVINGQTYVLPANDPRYVFPIPSYIINSTGIAQNPR
ncbi:MAG: RagB/SusD family nutrient uptake outer membrane protein [Pedobacter sp.]|jgi:tetratricopeptide (TPR) repeat protein